MAVLTRIGEALEQQHAGAFGPPSAIGRRGKRLAAPIGRAGPKACELARKALPGHDSDAAGEGEGALTLSQRLGGEVNGDQRGAARGVDGDAGPCNPKV